MVIIAYVKEGDVAKAEERLLFHCEGKPVCEEHLQESHLNIAQRMDTMRADEGKVCVTSKAISEVQKAFDTLRNSYEPSFVQRGPPELRRSRIFDD